MSYNQGVENYRSQLQQKLETNPKDVEALIHLGALEFEYFHESELALSLLEKAVQVDPLNVDAKFWLAMSLYYDYFEYAKAESLLIEALQLNPKRPDCLSLVARTIQDNKRDPNESVEYVKKAVSYAPDWPMLRCQLARLHVALGNIESAEQEVETAMKLIPLDLKMITNEVDRYYESVVTGRGWNDKKTDYFYILEYIQAAKEDRSKNANYS